MIYFSLKKYFLSPKKFDNDSQILSTSLNTSSKDFVFQPNTSKCDNISRRLLYVAQWFNGKG